MYVSEEQFKSCLSAFTTGVTVVTALDKAGEIHGITVNSFNSVSLSPPMILFSLEKKATRFDIFTSCSNFTVNILSNKQKHISEIFAARDVKDWSTIKHRIEYDVPVLEGVLSYLYCSKKYEYEGGDHKIIVGEVISAHKVEDNKPLLYYKHCYYTIGKSL